MKPRFTWFNITSVTLGFAFLYLPIVLLVIYLLQRLQAGHRLGRLLDPMVRRAASTTRRCSMPPG